MIHTRASYLSYRPSLYSHGGNDGIGKVRMEGFPERIRRCAHFEAQLWFNLIVDVMRGAYDRYRGGIYKHFNKARRREVASKKGV